MIAKLRWFLAVVPTVTVALVHAGTCPACWPLVGGLASSLGLTFLVETRYLLPLMIGCIAIAIAALSYGARCDYRPLLMGVAASAVVLIGKFILDARLVTVAGIGLLVAHISGVSGSTGQVVYLAKAVVRPQEQLPETRALCPRR